MSKRGNATIARRCDWPAQWSIVLRGWETGKVLADMRTIVLFGNSLAVSSVGASLKERDGLAVVPVNAGLADPASELNALEPDVVIFDLAATQPSFAVALLRIRPGLLLIGVDLLINKALVLSSETSNALTTDDLVQVIESHIGGPEKEIA